MPKSMSEVEVERRKQIEEYVMPYAFIGQAVLFQANKGAEWELAFVTRVRSKYLTLAVLPPQQHDFNPKDGVKHRTDPSIPITDTNGYWDYTELDQPIADKLKAKAVEIDKARKAKEREEQRTAKQTARAMTEPQPV